MQDITKTEKNQKQINKERGRSLEDVKAKHSIAQSRYLIDMGVI